MDSYVAQSIRSARRSLKMSQAEFAQALGASQGSVSKWEAGREVPRLETLEKIAELAPNIQFTEGRLIWERDPDQPEPKLFMARAPLVGSFRDGAALEPSQGFEVTFPCHDAWKDRVLKAYDYVPDSRISPEPDSITLIIATLGPGDRVDDIGPMHPLILAKKELGRESLYLVEFHKSAPSRARSGAGAGALWPISKMAKRYLLPIEVDSEGRMLDNNARIIGVQLCALLYTARLAPSQLEPSDGSEFE
ncbi:helix-turn-helix transcriptional regulator [Rhizobium sp. 268]|uniref:helix-turn-helix transcriptional regulator n=1 Tax=Rhizobium sp. 268 TaxID=2996375 RepID=UPI002F95FBA6